MPDELIQTATLGQRSDDNLMELHFGSIWVEFQCLDPAARAQTLEDLPERIQKALKNAGTLLDTAKDLSWSDLAILRIRVMERTPVDLLRSRAPAIRTELQSLVGDEGFKRLRPNGAVDELTADPKLLVADLIQMVDLTSQVAGQGLNNEGFRKGIAKWMLLCAFSVAFAALLLAAAALGWSEPRDWLLKQLPALGTGLAAVAFGVTGAYVSAQRRMQPPTIQSVSFATWFALRQFYNTTKYALVLGAVFAVLWWLMMVGGMLQGSVFPKFSPGAPVPESITSWAMFLIWSFASGFAERLVLDTLERLTNTKAPVQVAAPAPPPGK